MGGVCGLGLSGQRIRSVLALARGAELVFVQVSPGGKRTSPSASEAHTRDRSDHHHYDDRLCITSTTIRVLRSTYDELPSAAKDYVEVQPHSCQYICIFIFICVHTFIYMLSVPLAPPICVDPLTVTSTPHCRRWRSSAACPCPGSGSAQGGTVRCNMIACGYC